MPTTEHGKAVASRNATTHGLFARDIVLPSLGEDPGGYHQLEAQWLAQLPPRTLLERHYVEKIAAASWRLRRLHRWQAQLFEDETLTEDERLTKLDKVLRHETALHRQIDTAVKMLNKDAPQLFARRVRDEVLEDMRTSERECRDSAREETEIDLETRGRLRRIRKATERAMGSLSGTALDTGSDAAGAPLAAALPPSASALPASPIVPEDHRNCQNEPAAAGPSLGPYDKDSDDKDSDDKDSDDKDSDECTDAGDPHAGRWEPFGGHCQNEPGVGTAHDRRAFLASFPGAMPGSSSSGHTPATR